MAVDWLIQPLAFSIVHIVPGDAIASCAYSIIGKSNFYCKNDSVAISFLFSFGDGDKNLLNKKRNWWRNDRKEYHQVKHFRPF